MPTLGEALRQATQSLAEAGIADPRADARLLLCEAAGIDRVALLRDPDTALTPETAARLDASMAQRLARKPVSRILGRREFWGLGLLVTSAVLDPRPDTETLVEAALRHVGQERTGALTILDLGTGSGAILCALLKELDEARGWGVDRSLPACRVARTNLESCGLGGRGLIAQGDWADAFAPGIFDLVVSNPPYIETATIDGLDPEVRLHDPSMALDGGSDGLSAYRAIAAALPRLLAPGGAAFLEVGLGQADAVSALLAGAGLVTGKTHRDLAGIERVVSAQRLDRRISS